MEIRYWLIALFFSFSTMLFAQNETSKKETSTEGIADLALSKGVYYEKDIYIHRYILEDKVDVEIVSSGKATFSLLNESRVEVRGYEMTLPAKSMHSVSLANLPKGKYYVRVKKDNKSFVRKVFYE